MASESVRPGTWVRQVRGLGMSSTYLPHNDRLYVREVVGDECEVEVDGEVKRLPTRIFSPIPGATSRENASDSDSDSHAA